jgi:phosphoethanolamine N-methyltransferase
VSFEAADVMAMAFEAGCFELVFTNWLFMYLNDAELAALAPRLLRCLAPGGRLFFRESCNRQSGDRSRAFNPSHYRQADAYTRLFETTQLPCGARFRLEASGSVKTYVQQKGNPNQIYWMWVREG